MSTAPANGTPMAESVPELTVDSPLNFEVAKRLFPRSRVELVKFGIRANAIAPPKRLPKKARSSMLSVGNDRHRDRKTLVDALRGDPRFEGYIARHLELTPHELVNARRRT